MMKALIAFLAALALASQAAAFEFSGVAAQAGGRSANITWSSPVECPAQLTYGLTAAYGKMKSATAKTTSHALSVTGLEPYTVYHYLLRCKANNSYTANSTDYTFKTLEVLPDIVLTKLTATPQSAAADKKVKLKAYVRNAGEAKASNVAVDIVCPGGQTIRKTIAAINPAASSNAEVECPPPSGPGQYTATATADPDGAIAERDEGNNQAQTTVTYSPQPKPDLEVT
jgi:hypothetical protein